MKPKLPPRYVNTPVEMVYSDTPAPIKETYFQLRGLAWESGDDTTPPLTFAELSVLLNKSGSTIYEHLRWLRERHWLLFSDAGSSAYRFAFVDPEPASFSEISERCLIKSLSLKSENTLNEGNELIKEQPRSESLETDDGKRASDPNLRNPAVILYRGMTHITANGVQRAMIAAQVRDVEAWRDAITHWMEHGWSKMNVSGMVSSYCNGGRAGCSLCRKNGAGGNRKGAAPSVLDELKRRKAEIVRQNGNGR